MADAGGRGALIEIQRATVVRDAYGEDVETAWPVFCRAWAAILWGRGGERREAAAQQVVQSATFQVLNNAQTRAVTEQDRIVWNGRAWNIGVIAELAGGRIEFTAVRGEAV